MSKDTAVLETFPQAREKRTNGPSVLLALLGGRRGETADDASPWLLLLENLVKDPRLIRLQRTLGKDLCYEESKRRGHDGKKEMGRT